MPTLKLTPEGDVLPDGPWSWVVTIGNSIIGMTTIAFFRTYTVYFHPIMSEYDIDYAAVASLPGLFVLGMAIGCFVLPALTRTFGSRKLCIAAGLIQCLSIAISSQVHSFVAMQICTGFIAGFATGILYFTMMSSSSRYFIKHRAKATGISTLGIPLGTLILAPGTDRLISIYGWRGALFIMSGLLLHSCVSAALYRPVKVPESRKKSFMKEPMALDALNQTNAHSEEQRSGMPTSRLSKKQSVANFAQDKMKLFVEYHIFKSISYDIALISSVFFYCGYVGAITFLVPFGREYTGLDNFQASTMLSMVGAAECIAKVITGFLADNKRVNKCILVALSSLAASVCVIIMTRCQTYWSLATTSFLYGLFVTGYVGIIVVIFCEIVGPQNIAAAVGYQGFLYNCFLSLSLFLMGRLLDTTGDPRWIYYICSGLIVAAAVCVLIVYIRLKRKASDSIS